MANLIKLKRSATAGAVPATLQDGELAINQTDRKLFYRDGAGTIRAFSLTVADTEAALAGLKTPRNRHVNPAMQVCQDRATGATLALSAGGGGYALDGVWVGAEGGGVMTCAQVASPSPGGSPCRFRATVTTPDTAIAAADYYVVCLPIEGCDVADLQFGTAAARSFVWRGVVRMPAGTYGLSFYNGNSDRSYFTTFTIAAGQANTDTLVTATVPGDTAGTWYKTPGTVGLWASITLAAGTTWRSTAGSWKNGLLVAPSAQTNWAATAGNVFELCDVGLYTGSVPPTWELPDFADALRKCQRYYERISFVSNTNRSYLNVPYKVAKYATPALSLVSGSISGASLNARDADHFTLDGTTSDPVACTVVANARM